MLFNEIKSNEWLLQDDTKSAWLVGYIAKNADIQGEISAGPDTYEAIDIQGSLEG